MAFFDFLTNILGGGQLSGIRHAERGLEEARGQESEFLESLRGDYAPYMEAGRTAVGEYLPAIEEMRDPQTFFEQMMKGYETSPTAQRSMDEGIRAATQGSLAGGIGGGQMMKELEEFGRTLTAEDQDRWFNTMMGIRGGYTGGLENLMSGGRQAISSFAPVGASMTGDIADMIAQQGLGRGAESTARYKPYMDWLGKGMSMVGNAATGGMSGGASQLMGLGV